MAKFDMITWADERYRKECYEINNQYFTIDTAAPDEVYDWVNHNRLMVTYALLNDHVHGFFNVMPLTREAGELFEKNSITEEEITIHHILPPQHMHLAEYLYFPAIAVRDYRSYISHQCTAALMATLTTHLRTMYSMHKLKKIFVNPTTFSGNMMVRKLGLKPLVGFKKPLKGNDLYFADFTNDLLARLNFFEERYGEFVGQNCWLDKSYQDKLDGLKK